MNEKNTKISVYTICILLPLLPTYLVMAVIHPILNPISIIVIACVEYFGFQYVIALFIKKLAENRQRKTQRLQEMIKE